MKKRWIILILTALVVLFQSRPVNAQQWLLPEPSGNPLTDLIFFNDSIGLAAFAYDGIYRTTDGGASWTWVCSTGGENCSMLDIRPGGQAVAMCKTYLLYSGDYGQTWTQTGQLNNMSYLKIQLIDDVSMVSFIELQATNSYAIGKSVDTGQSWVIDTLTWSPYPWMRIHYNDISFETLQKGIVVEYEGPAYKTLDGGKTLIPINQPLLGAAYDKKCAVLAPDTFMVIGLPGNLKLSESQGKSNEVQWYYLSYDGGTTWTEGYIRGGVRIDRLKVKHQPDIVLFYGRDLGLYPPVNLFYSSDKGQTWQFRKFGEGINLAAADVMPSGKVLAYEAEDFYQLLSSPAGDTLLHFSPGIIPHSITSVDFAGLAGYLASGSIIYRSEDGGNTWDSVSLIPSGVIDLSFSNEFMGILAAENEAIYATNDRGNHWTQKQQLGKPAGFIKLFPGGLAYIGGENFLYKSMDYCSTLSTIDLPSDMNVKGFSYLDEQTLFAFGNDKTLGDTRIDISQDGGLTWTSHHLNIGEIIKLQMLNDEEGIAMNYNEMYSIHLGLNQANKILQSNGIMLDMAFSSPSQGYALVTDFDEYTKILSTTDGGNTWVINGICLGVNKVKSFYGMNGMAFGDYGRLLALEMGYPVAIPEEKRSEGIVVYPNPASDFLNVMVKNKGLTRLIIRDMTGREINKWIVFENKTLLDIHTLKPGVYILQATGANKGMFKFLKNN